MNRESLEQQENTYLASYALKNSLSKGRIEAEKKDPLRLDFARDRDRIIHTKAFRRLKGKTQVFVNGFGDHYRSRLTHTLEVAQIARTLARIFRANEDLVEAVALAHDLGHTPFGHAGQELLAKKLKPFGKTFEHNAQSRHILEILEPKNLCIETLQCLCKHPTRQEFINYNLSSQNYLEGQIVDIADAIAYLSADLQDGIESGLISRKLFLFVPENPIDAMVSNLATTVLPKLESYNSHDQIREMNTPIVSFSTDFLPIVIMLKKNLMQHLYQHPTVLSQTNEGVFILNKLFDFFIKNPSKIPENIDIIDFLAGMTDDYAKETFQEIFKTGNN